MTIDGLFMVDYDDDGYTDGWLDEDDVIYEDMDYVCSVCYAGDSYHECCLCGATLCYMHAEVLGGVCPAHDYKERM